MDKACSGGTAVIPPRKRKLGRAVPAKGKRSRRMIGESRGEGRACREESKAALPRRKPAHRHGRGSSATALAGLASLHSAWCDTGDGSYEPRIAAGDKTRHACQAPSVRHAASAPDFAPASFLITLHQACARNWRHKTIPGPKTPKAVILEQRVVVRARSAALAPSPHCSPCRAAALPSMSGAGRRHGVQPAYALSDACGRRRASLLAAVRKLRRRVYESRLRVRGRQWIRPRASPRVAYLYLPAFFALWTPTRLLP